MGVNAKLVAAEEIVRNILPKHVRFFIQLYKVKKNKYDELSQNQNCTFIPFVIETYGGLGKRAQGFLNELSIFAIDHAVIRSRFDIVNGLRYAIACSVQRGNALIAAAGYANSLNVSRA